MRILDSSRLTVVGCRDLASVKPTTTPQRDVRNIHTNSQKLVYTRMHENLVTYLPFLVFIQLPQQPKAQSKSATPPAKLSTIIISSTTHTSSSTTHQKTLTPIYGPMQQLHKTSAVTLPTTALEHRRKPPNTNYQDAARGRAGSSSWIRQWRISVIYKSA